MKSTCALNLMLTVLLAALTASANAQTFHLLHTFEGTDGLAPAGLTMDQGGNLYGAAAEGGIHNCPAPNNAGCGAIFELFKANWSFKTLYQFQSRTDGWSPNSPLTLDATGNLYGTTLDGGIEGGGGTVFRVWPTCYDLGCNQIAWKKTILYRFGQCDGAGTTGGLVFDNAGNLYGTTVEFCGQHTGEAYELSPAQNLNGTWNMTRQYVFYGPPDGRWPVGPMVFDHAGNLYGSTLGGGNSDLGTAYRLSPAGKAWSECVLYNFTGAADGRKPIGNVIFDRSGNLYGVTNGDSQPSGVFELPPAGCGQGAVTPLFDFVPGEGAYLASGLVMDAAGNLYGAAPLGGAYGYGSVYKLTPISDGWSYSSLHDFTGGSDGSSPQGPLVLDSFGNLFGSAAAGGDLGCHSGIGCGTVWVIKLNWIQREIKFWVAFF
jgi:uncharacterized repeat protein (TIGR03803 family)